MKSHPRKLQGTKCPWGKRPSALFLEPLSWFARALFTMCHFFDHVTTYHTLTLLIFVLVDIQSGLTPLSAVNSTAINMIVQISLWLKTFGYLFIIAGFYGNLISWEISIMSSIIVVQLYIVIKVFNNSFFITSLLVVCFWW